MKNNNQNSTNRVPTFESALTNYETASIVQSTDYTTALQTLSAAVAYSVLKKCINVSVSPQLITIRRELTAALHNLDTINRANNTAYRIAYDGNGEPYADIIDKDLHSAVQQINNNNLGSGIDLMQTATVAILDETRKARERNSGALAVGYMSTPYTVRRLKKRVYIKKSDSANGFETVETTPIQEVYKAVRREIQASGAMQTATNGYTYLAELATDTESGASETIYRRFGKYADIGGVVRDVNGAETAYTTDTQTATDTDTIIATLNLTARQMQVLQLRLSGYGIKAIGTYLGVSHQAIAKTLKQIQTKCIANGYMPPKTNETDETVN